MTYRICIGVRYTLFKNAIRIFLPRDLPGTPSSLVLLLIVALYFLMFAGLAGLIVFAPARAALLRGAERIAFSVGGRMTRCLRGFTPGVFAPVRTRFQRSARIVIARRRLLAWTLAALVTPSLLVAWSLETSVFDFIDRPTKPDPKIALLLTGERLSAPPPLAPEMFTTREVERVRPATSWASRDWALLDDAFRQRLLSLFKLMREEHGYEMVILEGYRSPQRQAALAALGPNVTQAGPGMSYHQHGLAADSAFLRDGQLVISAKDPWAMRGYRLYGLLAERLGLTWGGNWRMRDYGHVELRVPGALGRAQAYP